MLRRVVKQTLATPAITLSPASAKSIVDRFKKVDVHHQERQRALISPEARPFLLGEREKLTSVVQPGQAVDLGKTHKVGHVRIGEHPSAVTQHDAAHMHDLSAAHAKLLRSRIAAFDPVDALVDESVESSGNLVHGILRRRAGESAKSGRSPGPGSRNPPTSRAANSGTPYVSAVEQYDPVVDLIQGRSQRLEPIVVAHDVGHVHIGQQAAARWQCLALEADQFPVGQSEIKPRFISVPNSRQAVSDVGIKVVARHRVGLRIPAVTDEPRKRWLLVRNLLRQAEYPAKSRIDELRSQVPVEQHDAVFDLVEAPAQRGQLAGQTFQLGGSGICAARLRVARRLSAATIATMVIVPTVITRMRARLSGVK